jgi:hypothetical protein
MQAIRGKTQNFLNIHRFLNVVVNGMEIFDTGIQVAKTPLEFSFLPLHRLVKLVQTTGPFVYLLRGFADQETEDAEDRGRSQSHIAVESQALGGTKNIPRNLGPDRLSRLPEKNKPQNNPPDGGKYSEKKSTDSIKPTAIDVVRCTQIIHALSPLKTKHHGYCSHGAEFIDMDAFPSYRL